jgi:hypothetical protein
MQHSAPPQYSADGRWWWNGRGWIPVAEPEAAWGPADWAPFEERRRRAPAVLWVGMLALAALLTLAAGGPAASWLAQQGARTGGQAAPAIPAPTPVPTPTATPAEGQSAVDGYRQVVVAGVDRFQSAAQAVSDRCAPVALGRGTVACRTALLSLDDVVRGFQSDLDATPVPVCVQPADSELRSALTLYHQGIEQELQGLDRRDLAALAEGAGTLRGATGHAQAAGRLLQSAC